MSLGFRRPGLVVNSRLDSLVEHRFSSGFHMGIRHNLMAEHLPPLDVSLNGRKQFERWFLRNRPDVILTLHSPVREWLEEMRAGLSGGVGVAHLDIGPGMDDWSGMNQNNDQVGMAAADLLVAQLHCNEHGRPSFTQCSLVQSRWVEGRTIARHR